MVNEVALDPREQLRPAIDEIDQSPLLDGEIITVHAPDMRPPQVKVDLRNRHAEVTSVPVEFVGCVVVGEREERYLGWVYEGPVSISEFELRKLAGGESGLPSWLKQVLGPRCVRASVLGSSGGTFRAKVEVMLKETAR